MKIHSSELIGRAVGWVFAPVAAAGSALRHARILHPTGVVYEARVEPLAHGSALGDAAEGLAGKALVRLSSALWEGERALPDVLGFAVRISGDRTPLEDAVPGDQDILFATIRRPFTMPFAPFSTDAHSFLRNDYFAVSPFHVEGVGRSRLRIVAPPGASEAVAGDRREKLHRDDEIARAVQMGLANFRLELRRTALGAAWQPFAMIRLTEAADVDQEALRFSPFQTDRGLSPRGFVHGLRRGVYEASQRARPSHD